MTKEELIEYLKDNLSISVDAISNSFSGYAEVDVTLYLEDELISSDSATIDLE